MSMDKDALDMNQYFRESEEPADVSEDAKNPKKLRRKRKDPKRSRAAKKAAAKPGAKRARSKARKKFAKSGAGRQFFKKLGKFNVRRSMTKAEGGMRHNVLAIREFLDVNPPEKLRMEAEGIHRDILSGQFGWEEIRDRIDRLAEKAEGKRPMIEAEAHIESSKREAEKLTGQITKEAKAADKSVDKLMGIDMGFGGGHGYGRDVGQTSSNVATFYVKIGGMNVPELKHPDIIWDIIGWENEAALSDLKDNTGWDWYQVGRSGGHLLVDVGGAPYESDVMSNGWGEEPGEELDLPTALAQEDIKYLQEQHGITDPEYKNDPSSWVAYVDDLELLLVGVKAWKAWVDETSDKLQTASKSIKGYLKWLPQAILDSIEANEYELADPEEWSSYFKSPLPASMRSDMNATP